MPKKKPFTETIPALIIVRPNGGMVVSPDNLDIDAIKKLTDVGAKVILTYSIGEIKE